MDVEAEEVVEEVVEEDVEEDVGAVAVSSFK
jgi:hypothetical protein